MHEDDDAERVRECLSGNPQAFAAFVDQYEKPVYNVALRMLRSRDDASDVTQTVFLKAFQGLAGYDPRFRFYSWLYRIAINESLDALRLRKRQAGPVEEGQPSTDPGPDEAVAAASERREVLDAIDSLKPDYRAVIVLKYFAEQSYEEIARILGIEEKTVRSRLFTARQLLKDHLGNTETARS